MSEKRKPLLGCIADDVTGATDLAINLVSGGMKVTQWIGLPTEQQLVGLDADALVIALKSRSAPVDFATERSLNAAKILKSLGCKKFFFKYCSTFDSTPAGNIGPVAEALADFLGCPAVYCPAFPENGRTLYQGHLFVGDRLLSESSMRNHPLTPMHDPDIVRVLSQQTKNDVRLLSFRELEKGARRLRDQVATDSEQANYLVDCCHDQHLEVIAEGLCHLPLLTGGSGIARFLPTAWRQTSELLSEVYFPEAPTDVGRKLILAGSCSEATNRQVRRALEWCEGWQIDVHSLLKEPGRESERVKQWIASQSEDATLMIYSTAEPAAVASAQQEFGTEKLAAAIEQFHGEVARLCKDEMGIQTFVVAGGETAGAVVAALGIGALVIGQAICAGVPWTKAVADVPLQLALKSGNFGSDNFFADAMEKLQ